MRRRERNGAERMDAPDGNLAQHRLEAGDLLRRRVETKLKFLETELKRLLGDFAPVVNPAVAPVCRKGKPHFAIPFKQATRADR